MIYFLHVVKTGGSTVIEHAKKHLRVLTDLRGEPKFDDPQFVGSHNITYGVHRRFADPAPRYLMIIREPASWYLSVFHHDEARRKRGISFERWYEVGGINTVIPQHTVRDREFEYVRTFHPDPLELMSILDWVMLTDRLSKQLPAFCREIGIPADVERFRVTGEYSPIDGFEIPKIETMTKKMKARIYEENPPDVRLYEEAVKHGYVLRQHELSGSAERNKDIPLGD